MALVQASDGLTPGLRRRMLRLIEHAVTEGADAVLLTCSSYAPVVDIARRLWPVPIAKPDEAMYRQVARDRVRRVGLVASTQAALPAARAQLQSYAEPEELEITEVCCSAALPAARRADFDLLAAVVGRSTAPLLDAGVDVVVLAQYSLAPIRQRLAESLGVAVYSAPQAAADQVRELLDGTASNQPAPRKDRH